MRNKSKFRAAVLSLFVLAVAFVVEMFGFTSTANAFFFRRNVVVVNNFATPAVAIGGAVLPAFSTQVINTGLGAQAFVFSPNNAVLASGGFVGGVRAIGFGAGFGFAPRVAVRAGGVRVAVGGGVGFRRVVGVGVGGRFAFRRFR